jgi:hypothetical protein
MTTVGSDTQIWDMVLAGASPADRTRIEKATDTVNPPPFRDFVMNAIEADGDAGKPGQLSRLLLETGIVVTAISNPALLTLEDALRLATAAARIDSGLDHKILAHLTRASRRWPKEVPKPEIMRALTVIDAISDCERLVFPLMKFAKIEQPHLRSKAVKLLARGNRNPNWADAILADPNPRVRSNLIEEIAAQIGRKAEPLLRKGVKDPHHRVATTSLLALCRLGDEGSCEALKTLATEGNDMQRRAAAWALRHLEKPAEPIPSIEAPHPTA